MRIHTVLIATDFSPQADIALEYAALVASRAGAMLTVMHAEPSPGMAMLSAEPIVVPPQIAERLRGDRSRELDRVVAEVGKKHAELNVQPLFKSGSAAESIVEAAQSLGADLVVLGSHGAGGVDRFLLGSVVEKVSRSAPCPVLVVRDGNDGTRPLTRVLVATDFSPFARAQAEAAQAIAEPGGELELLHVWAPPHLDGLFTLGGASPQDDLGRMFTEGEAKAADALAELAATVDAPEARSYIQPSTSAAAGILDRARVVDADLIVVGAHDGSAVENALGTVADRVLRHAECPVLLVPEPARAAMDRSARPTVPTPVPRSPL